MYIEHQQVINEIEIHASIDRLTILGKTKFIDLFEQQLLNNNTIKKVMRAEYPYRKAFITVDGSYIAISGDDVKNMPNVRVDFNPNTLSDEGKKDLLEIIRRTVRPRLSRIDVAVDYIGKDLSQMEWHEAIERKRQTIQSASGKLETLYLGSFSSDKLTRIYDKGKEQKVDYLWWRVEAQVRMSRGDKLFRENPFKGLYGYERGAGYETLDLEVRATMQYLEKHPTAISQLSRRRKQHYRTLMQSTEKKLEPSPEDVFEKEKGNLRQQIAEWLQPANQKN